MLSDLRSLGFGASLRVAIGDATQDTIRSPKSRLRSFIEGLHPTRTALHTGIDLRSLGFGASLRDHPHGNSEHPREPDLRSLGFGASLRGPR